MFMCEAKKLNTYRKPYALYFVLADDLLKQKLFQLLKCTQCDTHIHAAIITCVDGHPFCSGCAGKNTECNSCGNGMTSIRCLPMERLRDKAGCNCPKRAVEVVSTVTFNVSSKQCKQWVMVKLKLGF